MRHSYQSDSSGRWNDIDSDDSRVCPECYGTGNDPKDYEVPCGLCWGECVL
jgi:DnaJ-class molecular chaperone